MDGVRIDGVTYAFLAAVMVVLMGGALWGVKRFVEASDRLRDSMESIEEAITLLRLEVAKDYPTRKEVKDRFDEHVDLFHRE